MKLCRFTQNGVTRIGKVQDGMVIDLSAVPGVGTSMRALLADLPALRPALAAATGPAVPLAEVTLAAPISDPQKFLAIGMNYKAHAEEVAAKGIPTPTSQLWFNKQVSCINGPIGDIEKPAVSDEVDYEAELAFVIGTRCRAVPEARALSVVAGYLVCNDVSARDWQRRSPTFTLGKSFDTHGPIGPWITTADEIPDPQALTLRLTVNGEQRQRSTTADMIYSIRQQIAYLSTVMTLEPGDLIATGTPSGVGLGSGRFLRPGDVVRVEVEGLGSIENRVVEGKEVVLF
jgi:2-keto-4-pentenoate hydratase/2-oxohepta-3-ene-1,7-dioic acid hydratase in catechol pathway